MSNFFDKSDLTRKDVDKIVSDTLKNCDDGELYLEDSKSESILLDDNKIKSSNYSSDLGFGFRAISNEVVAYSHSNEISKDSLKNSAKNLQSTLKSIYIKRKIFKILIGLILLIIQLLKRKHLKKIESF